MKPTITPELAHEAALLARERALRTVTVAPCVVRAQGGATFPAWIVFSPMYPERFHSVWATSVEAEDAVRDLKGHLETDPTMTVEALAAEILARASELA